MGQGNKDRPIISTSLLSQLKPHRTLMEIPQKESDKHLFLPHQGYLQESRHGLFWQDRQI